MKIVSVSLTDRVLPVGPGLGDTGLLKDDIDIDIEDNSALNGATTLVDVDSGVLENSRGTIVLIDSNSIDDEIVSLLEDIALIGMVALGGCVTPETVFTKLDALLEIIVDVITSLIVFIADCGVSMILVDAIVWKSVTVNAIEVMDLILPSNVVDGATILVDIDSDVLGNSTGTTVLVDSNSIDDDIVSLLEDVVLIGTVVLRGCVTLETVVFIADCGISMILVDIMVWKLVTVNAIEVIDLTMLSDVAVGDTSLDAVHVFFKPIQFPLARLKVHSVTCLLFWPPNNNPSLLTLASVHNK